MRKAEIKFNARTAGWLAQDEERYHFQYDTTYLKSKNPTPLSFTLPLEVEPHSKVTLFPFFDGLIPEGWLLNIVEKNWKLNPRDRIGLLLACCKDCIGAVNVHPLNTKKK